MKKLITLFLLIISTNSFACSCNDISFEKAVDWADEIFLGRLIEIKEVKFEFNEQHPEEKYTRIWYALFEVEKKWKGSSKKYVKVYQSWTSCDTEFNALGRLHLIYAKKQDLFPYYKNHKSEVRLTTWLCSRTREYQGVNEPNNDIKLLEKEFPKKIILNSFHINYQNIFYGLIILFVGLFLGFKLKKTNKANQQAQQN